MILKLIGSIIALILVVGLIGGFFYTLFNASRWECIEEQRYVLKYTEVVDGKITTKSQQETQCMHYRR